MADPMDAIRATFFEECAELLESLETGLLALQTGPRTAETIDAVFRSVHSIKGGAAAFAFSDLAAFAHEFETALDAYRIGQRGDLPHGVPILLRACDGLRDLVAASQTGAKATAPDPTGLRALCGSNEVVPTDPRGDPDPLPSVPNGFPKVWTISFEPRPELLSSGNEPSFLFRSLAILGRIEVRADAANLPPLENVDPTLAYLRWTLRLWPSAPDLTETEIEAAFEFVHDLCDLRIAPGTEALAPGRASQIPDMGPRNAVPDIPSLVPTTIRVDLARVDRLVDLVGELVIAQSMLAQDMTPGGSGGNPTGTDRMNDLQQLTRDLQESVMAIRAQPVRSLFQRMERIVRETAAQTGKTVRLVTEGVATEIDKTVIERLADPLTHMIRNAIDHGLEDPQRRTAAGKDPTGTVTLRALQRSDRILIEVSDDGAGLDRPRICDRAIARGLLPPGAAPDPAEIDQLIFSPGFSTASGVSAVSGRGVGMDVVNRAIRDLSGSIAIESAEGAGCRITTSLPLTLAILDGMVVRSGRERMVLPLSTILEAQTADLAAIERLGTGGWAVRLHDRYVPLLDLGRSMGFAVPHERWEAGEDSAVLFIRVEGGDPFALRVDAIEAQRQVVVKGLDDNLGRVPCVSAATILGDGQIALIVDTPAIAAAAGLDLQLAGAA
ncbi:chemotaxis protein CheA [Jannaschia sp. S6380]|uniref:chemotaxis protein CheA n=1 Tax=Jannaschia sp. S6380 TaxID=2926408 RepID=UPI001FF1A07F|nr:chemotaxis protein CheA [Jannaschia sp. S6380]MCK0166603.1 chemotaxis protein CheA [Jannaschia sp. S6380]